MGYVKKMNLLERAAMDCIYRANECMEKYGTHTREELENLKCAIEKRKEMAAMSEDDEKYHQEIIVRDLEKRFYRTVQLVKKTYDAEKGVRETVSGNGTEFRDRSITEMQRSGLNGNADGSMGAQGNQRYGDRTAQNPSVPVVGKYKYPKELLEVVDSWMEPKPGCTLEDYIGGHKAVMMMQRYVENLNRNTPELDRLLHRTSVRMPLLVGDPGTGKTFLARCAAGSAMKLYPNFKFMSLKASVLLDSKLGNSEKLVSLLFDVARQNAPCLVFIDEVEQLMGKKTEDAASYDKRIISSFQIGMSDLCDQTELKICFMGASNHPEMMENAVKDRMEIIKVPLPDKDVRVSVFEKAYGWLKLEQISFEDLGEMTAGFTHRDLNRVKENIGKRIDDKLEKMGYDNKNDEKQCIDALKNGEIKLTYQMACEAIEEAASQKEAGEE